MPHDITMWGNPTLLHQGKSIEKKILLKDKCWQKLLTEESKY